MASRANANYSDAVPGRILAGAVTTTAADAEKTKTPSLAERRFEIEIERDQMFLADLAATYSPGS